MCDTLLGRELYPPELGVVPGSIPGCPLFRFPFHRQKLCPVPFRPQISRGFRFSTLFWLILPSNCLSEHVLTSKSHRAVGIERALRCCRPRGHARRGHSRAARVLRPGSPSTPNPSLFKILRAKRVVEGREGDSPLARADRPHQKQIHVRAIGTILL